MRSVVGADLWVSTPSSRSISPAVRVIATFGVGIAWVGAFAIFGHAFSTVGSDAWNYLAAGERLNAGHRLYALSPGDRFVSLAPPYWSIPLLSPPPIAVAWRPLALLGDGSMDLWWAGGLVSCLWLQAGALRSGSVAQVLLTLAAAPVLALTAVSGNANAYLVPLLAWSAGRRNRPDTAGGVVAILVAVKVTPILLIPWVAKSRGSRGFLIASLVIMLVTIAGAGPDSFLAWWNGAGGSAPSPLSIAAGVHVSPAIVAFVTASAALLGATILRAHPRAIFVIGVVASVAATPALYFQALAMVATIPAIFAPSATGDRGEASLTGEA